MCFVLDNGEMPKYRLHLYRIYIFINNKNSDMVMIDFSYMTFLIMSSILAHIQFSKIQTVGAVGCLHIFPSIVE